MKSRRKFSPEFKAKVALDAIKEHESLKKLGLRYQIHPNLIARWKKEFLQKTSSVFKSENDTNNQNPTKDSKKQLLSISHQRDV